MRSFFCKVLNERFLLQIVEFEFLATTYGMRSFSANCGQKSFCYELWNEKFLFQIVE